MDEPNLYGKDLFGAIVLPPPRGKIADKFLISPFSVLNAREGFWQDRKNAWIGMGIKGETGRVDNLLGMSELMTLDANNSTSVFDPVVCELAYRWFCKEGDLVLDPFAGGSVRGIVAEQLNRKYYGIELRREQVDANKEQAEMICGENKPVWICGDSMDELENAPNADFIFTCPPYGDLEKYSDDPRDLSTMEYHTFIAAYKRIIMRACGKLRTNRFACVVVGDFRNEKGNYRNFVSDTIAAFKEQGLELYNEAVLITPLGNLQMRVERMFDASRKLGKSHQNILVFIKGEGKAAAKRINEVC